MAGHTNSAARDKDIKEMFQLFDKDHDNMISEKELKLVLREFGNPTDAEIQNLLKQMEVKKGDKVNYEKFKKLIENEYYSRPEEEELKSAFSQFDKNKNGTIDKKELKTVLMSIGEKMTDAQVDEMFKSVDLDQDGKIQYREFVKLFTRDLKS